jgi:hypothetical protein
MARSRSVRTLIFLLLFAAGAGALAVLKVPMYKQVAKRYWRDFQRPSVPTVQTEFIQVDGRTMPKDPAPFAGTANLGPNLQFHFPPPGHLVNEKSSPAIIRVVGDVADSLISVSAGITFTCADSSLDLRICLRIDHADGTPVEWNEKRLLAQEHRANEVERFNFEWLLRELPVRPDDRIAVFLRNPDRAEVVITDMNVVFRSASPFRTQANP